VVIVVTGMFHCLLQQFIPVEDNIITFTESATLNASPVMSSLFVTSVASTFPKSSEMENVLALLPDFVSLMTIVLAIYFY
jgi:hypothetical protein